MDRRTVIVLAFILSVIFVPGIIGAQIPTGWGFLSAVLPFVTWRRVALPPGIKLAGAAFFAYAFASLAWCPDTYFGIYSIWLLAMFAGCFVLGSQLESTTGIAKGLALGLTVSSALAVAQHFGWNPVYTFSTDRPPGLLFNPVSLSESIAVVIVWLVIERLWLYIPALLPGLWLSQGRGAFLALGVTLVFYLLRRSRWFAPAVTLTLSAVALFAISLILHPTNSDNIRLQLWYHVTTNLRPFGWGAGAITSALITVGNLSYSPEYAHNEFLDLAYQFGIGTIPAIAVWAWAFRRDVPERWPLVCFSIMAFYSFPLHVPTLALAGGVLSGYCCRDWALARHSQLHRRSGFHLRYASA